MYFCDAPAKNKAFRALVLPVLDYASAVWNPHTLKSISALEKIQNCGARWVCGSRYNCHSHTCNGLSPLVNVVVSTIGHLFLHDVSISQ